MKCERCSIETFVHKVLTDKTYTYVCRNPQCSEYNVVKTALGEEVPDVFIDTRTAVPCACSELLYYVDGKEIQLPAKINQSVNIDKMLSKMIITCPSCGHIETVDIKGKDVKEE